MTRKSITTLASTIIGAGDAISSVVMAESLMRGFPMALLAPDRSALYPIAVFLLSVGTVMSLVTAVVLIRYGGSVQQGVYSDQSGVIDALVGGNRFVAIQAAANVFSVLAQNIAVPYGPALAFIGAVTAILFALFSIKKLNDVQWELRR